VVPSCSPPFAAIRTACVPAGQKSMGCAAALLSSSDDTPSTNWFAASLIPAANVFGPVAVSAPAMWR
jgi:hypothetical protein